MNVGNMPDHIDAGPAVGDVYATTKGTFNAIVAIRGNTAYCLVFDKTGEITGAQQYAINTYLSCKFRVGVIELPDMLNVAWEPWS